jgi:outer membrane protein TolC
MITLACLLVLLLPGDPPPAGDPAPLADPPSATDGAKEAAPDAESGPLRITLEDAIELARVNNLTLAGARLDAAAAVSSFNSSWGAFDTIFFSNGTWSQSNTPPQVIFVNGSPVGVNPSSNQEFAQWRTGFRGTFLTGTNWTFDVGPQKNEFNGNAQVEGDWSLELSHPLLRNGADGYAQSGLELARHDANISSLAAETAATDTLQSVVAAYWNLLFTRADVKTRELSVQLATELLDITKRKFEQGLQNRINVTEVDAEVALRKQELLTAVGAEGDAQDELRRLVLAPQDSGQWNRPVELLTEPAPAQQRSIDVEQAIATALLYRADVASSRESLERAEVDVRRAQNQTRPLLDLTGGYGASANEQSYGEVYSHLDDTSFDERHVAFVFEVPIGNRGAGYELRRAQTARERAGVDLRETEMNAYREVRQAARAVETQIARVAATDETVRLQQETYDGEVRRLENDLSTPFQVRQTQRDLLSAIDAAKRAKLDLEIARSALLSAEGRLPYAYGMERSLPELSIDEAPPRP